MELLSVGDSYDEGFVGWFNLDDGCICGEEVAGGSGICNGERLMCCRGRGGDQR
jgi:hypothetical protein